MLLISYEGEKKDWGAKKKDFTENSEDVDQIESSTNPSCLRRGSC